jgi:putative flippase GtrA
MGMALAYWLFATAVFRNSRVQKKTSLLRFTIVNGLGLVQTSLIGALLIQVVNTGNTNLNEFLSHVGGMSVAVATSFIAHRKYTFGGKTANSNGLTKQDIAAR